MEGKTIIKVKDKFQKLKKKQRLKLAKQMVDKANELQDPLEPFQLFRKYNRNGIDAELFVERVTNLTEDVKQWIFNLTKQNMKDKYEKCSWGWSDSEKKKELLEDAAWYLIAKSTNGNLLGFSHFRFDLDQEIEVLYCYELQLELEVHRKGLGKFMMKILEHIAFKNRMKKVVLTILKNNPDSNFFKAINYQIDESSPIDDSVPYEILSKVLKDLV